MTAELKIGTLLDGRLNFVPSLALKYLPELRTLDIVDTDIQTLTADAFVEAEKMISLHLANNKVVFLINLNSFKNKNRCLEFELRSPLL